MWCIVLLGLNRVIVSVWISGEEQGEGFVEGGECAVQNGGRCRRRVSSRFPPSVSTLTLLHTVSASPRK
jgi:hypothetical protein